MQNLERFNIGTLKTQCKAKGYNFFERGSYNLNLIGIRSNERSCNSFDDVMCVAYKENDKWQLKQYQITTDPGLWELQKPSFVNAQENGTAIMACGQYTSSYALGYHGSGTWRHKALIQVGQIGIYRDKNKDSILDIGGRKEIGYFGINIHASSLSVKQPLVQNWSAGCQVFANPVEYNEFVVLLEKSVSLWGNKFTYTLFNESDF